MKFSVSVCIYAMYVILCLQSTFSKKFNALAVQILLCALLPFSFHILQVMLKIHAQSHRVWISVLWIAWERLIVT